MSPKGHAQIKGSADTVISLSYSYTTPSLKETSVSKVFGLWIHQNLWNIAITISNVSHCVLFLTRKNNFGSSCCATFFKLNNIFIENTPVYKQSLHEGLYSTVPETDLWTGKSNQLPLWGVCSSLCLKTSLGFCKDQRVAALEMSVLEEFSGTASSTSPQPSCWAEIPKIAYVTLVNHAPVLGPESQGRAVWFGVS